MIFQQGLTPGKMRLVMTWKKFIVFLPLEKKLSDAHGQVDKSQYDNKST